MTVYTSGAVTPAAAPLSASAQALYDDIARQSHDLSERLALLSGRAKLGAPPSDVEAVRQRLWADFDPGPPRPMTAAGGRVGAHRSPGGPAA